MREASEVMVRQILKFIETYSEAASDQPGLEEAFNATALQLFRFQMQHNEVYQKYAQLKRKTPLTVKSWRDIPPVPIQAFKHAILSCEPSGEAEAVFMTSGTTNVNIKGRQFHPTMKVWDASMTAAFKSFVMPDQDKITMYVLSPGKDLNENSSLSRYLSLAVERYGSSESQFFFAEKGLLMAELANALQESEAKGKAVLLLGASFSYIHFLDYCKELGLSFRLPEGSRILDTGGFKGQSREVEMEQLYDQFQYCFGIPRHCCINMYGMTELCSQFYDQTLYTHLHQGQGNSKKAGPAWLRTCVLNPDSLEPVEDGKPGVLAHYDLANWNSCAAILTEDLGIKTDNGFVLLGRVQGSEARGCSLAIDQFLQTNQQ